MSAPTDSKLYREYVTLRNSANPQRYLSAYKGACVSERACVQVGSDRVAAWVGAHASNQGASRCGYMHEHLAA